MILNYITELRDWILIMEHYMDRDICTLARLLLVYGKKPLQTLMDDVATYVADKFCAKSRDLIRMNAEYQSTTEEDIEEKTKQLYAIYRAGYLDKLKESLKDALILCALHMLVDYGCSSMSANMYDDLNEVLAAQQESITSKADLEKVVRSWLASYRRY